MPRVTRYKRTAPIDYPGQFAQSELPRQASVRTPPGTWNLRHWFLPAHSIALFATRWTEPARTPHPSASGPVNAHAVLRICRALEDTLSARVTEREKYTSQPSRPQVQVTWGSATIG